MKGRIAGVLAWGVLALAGPALAHHSFAMFDATRLVTLTGSVKEFQYTNPHSWLQVMIPDANGQAVEWSFEAEGPSTLLRSGIKKSTLMPGDKVTISFQPMKDGRPAGKWKSLVKADGTVLYTDGLARTH